MKDRYVLSTHLKLYFCIYLWTPPWNVCESKPNDKPLSLFFCLVLQEGAWMVMKEQSLLQKRLVCDNLCSLLVSGSISPHSLKRATIIIKALFIGCQLLTVSWHIDALICTDCCWPSSWPITNLLLSLFQVRTAKNVFCHGGYLECGFLISLKV